MQVRSLGQEDPLEEEMAIHSSILAWRMSLVGCKSMESQESDMAERLHVQPVLRSIGVHVFFIRLSVSGYLGCFGVHISF